MARLTKRVVDQIAVGDKETMHWDDELRGFGVRVWPSGRKVYTVMSRVKGRLRRITIGTHGTTTAEKARARAHELLSEAKNGRDPARELDQARKAPTMKGLGERFLREYVASRCKPTTHAEYKRSVELFINPKLGTRKVTDIERTDIAELHHELQHIPYQANRTLGVLSKMFNLAEIWGLRPDGSNLCRHVKKYVEQKRERFLDPAEIAELGRVLHEVEREGAATKAAINAIRLLMLTGCRLSEIMTLKWEHVDLKTRELSLPDSKTGARTVPFGKTAAAVLKGIEKVDDNPHVITGRKPHSHLTDLQHPWRRIRSKAGLAGLRIHDLRHSYASGALALGEGLPMIGKLLGHTQVQTTARYAHLARDPVKMAGSRVSDTIGAAMLRKTKKGRGSPRNRGLRANSPPE
jgi:integrase